MTRATTSSLFLLLLAGCGSVDEAPSDATTLLPDSASAGERPDGGASDDGGAPDAIAHDHDADAPTPRCRALTPDGSGWWDPELLDAGDELLIAWHDEAARQWVARLDRSTGDLVEGSERQVGDRGAPLIDTYNGPEFGVDAHGWAIYFTRVEDDGTHQIVRSRFDSTGTLETAALTRGPRSHFSALPTRDALAMDTRLVLLRRPEPWGTATWLDVSAPDVEHDLFFLAERPDADVRFVPGTRLLVTDGLDAGTGREEIVVLDTDDGTMERVSDGGGPFFNGYGWRDATGTLHALALTGDARITVWRREAAGWTRLGTLPSPDPDRLPYIGSPEPFVLGARSYVLFAASSTVDPRPGLSDQQIWVAGAEPSDAFAQRVDDGRSGVTRVDPEVAIDGDSVITVYYELVGRRSVTWSCHTRLADPG